MAASSPTFFTSATAFRAWLEKHHATVTELVVGFHKKSAGHDELTYAEAVDEALCFGWIDGLVRNIDATTHSRRFTPRKPGSIWSNVNVRHVARLTAAGKMQPSGLAAFAARSAAKTGIYSFESATPAKLSPEFENRFRRHKKAWQFFSAQAPWYRRKVIWRVMNAKQAATRDRRLEQLIARSAEGGRL